MRLLWVVAGVGRYALDDLHAAHLSAPQHQSCLDSPALGILLRCLLGVHSATDHKLRECHGGSCHRYEHVLLASSNFLLVGFLSEYWTYNMPTNCVTLANTVCVCYLSDVGLNRG